MSAIVTSPYSEREHLLELSTLDPAFQAAALGLRTFDAVDEKYATGSYLQSFNVGEVVQQMAAHAAALDAELPRQLYVIAFRSVLKPEIRSNADNIAVLMDADKRSHAEANTLGGLLKYWYGTADAETGHNLATCWWRSVEDARRGGTGPAHQHSVRHTRSWYAYWLVEQYSLTLSGCGWTLEALG